MFRNLISPVQAWLLSQGQCVGCGMLLTKGQQRKNSEGQTLIVCKCGRGYIKISEKKYQRARLSEMQ